MNLQQQALVAYVAGGAALTPDTRKQLADELRKHYQIAEAWEIWQEKTEWVQKTAQPGELGMHRADVLKARIEKLEKWKAEHEVATLSMAEMKQLLTWFEAVEDLNRRFNADTSPADTNLANRVKKAIKEAKP